MLDELSEFGDWELPASTAEERAKTSVVCDLLLFEYGGFLFAVPAGSVDAVVPWKTPAPVPGGDAQVGGVIQDRGRIVVVLAHPSGQHGELATAEAKRIVICTTARGLVGLPASTTNTIGPVELPAEPTPSTVYDSPSGPFTYLDPNVIFPE